MIPQKESVGVNSKIHKLDENPLVWYTDDYTDKLKQLCTVDEVLGPYTKEITAGDHEALAHFTMESGPFKSVHQERVLNRMLYAAAQIGEWVGVQEESDTIDMIAKTGFVFKTEHEGKTYAIPSLRFIAYCNDQKKS
ncbi:MAG: hypothetical protein KAT77_04525 [Nanoarchaeota archaeon]|nr:hypothetical protein [Nanoarchaeota archaeon]